MKVTPIKIPCKNWYLLKFNTKMILIETSCKNWYPLRFHTKLWKLSAERKTFTECFLLCFKLFGLNYFSCIYLNVFTHIKCSVSILQNNFIFWILWSLENIKLLFVCVNSDNWDFLTLKEISIVDIYTIWLFWILQIHQCMRNKWKG